MAGIISLFLGLFRLIEKLSKFYQIRKRRKQVFDGVLVLQDYKANLEKALEARRKARLELDRPDELNASSVGLPNDGFRRD